MSALLHTLLLSLSVFGAYWWLLTPSFKPYSLQVFAGTVLIYFLLKRLNKSKLWHILPGHLSLETAVATFAFLILIGSTGNTESIFYPLAYIHLFFIVFSSHPATAVTATMAIILFHYSLTPELAGHHLVSLLSLPIIMLFFLFARQQHEEAVKEKLIIKKDEVQLGRFRQENQQIKHLFHDFLFPKIDHLLQLLTHPQENAAAMTGQLELIRLELTRFLGRSLDSLNPDSLNSDANQNKQENQASQNQDAEG